MALTGIAETVDGALKASWKAFIIYRKLGRSVHAAFLRNIAIKLAEREEELVVTAAGETNLSEPRLKGELKRTIFQLNSYADACEEGSWLDIRIDTADKERNPPKPSLRKMMVPLGPVVVFGASNFPFAYSTAGGDTACALAAGCSVLVKAHPAHSMTSGLAASAIRSAALDSGVPEDVFIHLESTSIETGIELVKHPVTRAVGFTGSFEGGKALFDLANQRPLPIPVFAEMGSVNPVFLLPSKLQEDTDAIANMYAHSITQSAGQFCTNPGLLVAIKGSGLEKFLGLLGDKIIKMQPEKMLHTGIADSFQKNRFKTLEQEGVELIAGSTTGLQEGYGYPSIAKVSAGMYLKNPGLHKEVFGPFSLLVECRDMEEMEAVALSLEGQLTATLMATPIEVKSNESLVLKLEDCCGRFILNGVPTGVEVAMAMHHGGPFPATTDSRFTSVGADGIRRFARPVSFQNWEDDMLPPELQDKNPLNLWRMVNNQWSRAEI